MCRVELANTELLLEIENLDKKAQQRKQALIQSTKELDDDKKDIISFMEKNKKTKHNKELEEKAKIKEKVENEERLRSLDEQIQEKQSEIERNRDVLNGFNSYKEFIRSLTSKEFLIALD